MPYFILGSSCLHVRGKQRRNLIMSRFSDFRIVLLAAPSRPVWTVALPRRSSLVTAAGP